MVKNSEEKDIVLGYCAMVDAIRDEETDYQLRKRGYVYGAKPGSFKACVTDAGWNNGVIENRRKGWSTN